MTLINRGKSYLMAFDVDWGVAANFGKTKAEFPRIKKHPWVRFAIRGPVLSSVGHK
jgi:hypothetical protein